MKYTLILAAALGLCSSLSLQAAVSADQAAQLDNELTPLGAEKAGNADGSIPAWTGGGIENVPADFDKTSGIYPDPFAEEAILYTVTHENMGEYAELLSEGQKAMLEKWGPDGYVLNVYPSHRTFAAPDWFYKGSITNATGATLEDGGQRIASNVSGVPFPIPQNGMEVMWNHMIRWVGYEFGFTTDAYYVDSKGKPVLASTAKQYWEFPMFMAIKNPDRDYHTKTARWGYSRFDFSAPPRRAGEILLIHEPGADYTKGKGRSAWQYLTGQRRVRKAPAVSFDTPRAAAAGTATYDDTLLFNGSLERYDWKLIGKKEMLIPYNSYNAIFNYSSTELLGEHYVKPEALRFEKHRVWIVEGTLKDGSRHIYGKRRHLIDEDSWAVLDNMRWDRKGKLWRVGYGLSALMWDVPAPIATGELSYDLLSNIYTLTGKPNPGTLTNESGKTVQFYSPQGMARSGVR
jgi:hypothetical protein